MIFSKNSQQKSSLKIFYTNTTWSKIYSSDLCLMKSHKSTSFEVIFQIQGLVRKLIQVANIKRVRAIALRFPDLHNIDFELQLQPEIELSHEVWDQVQDIVIECEWKLRDDSGEKWYFHAEVVSKLSPLQDTSKVIVDFHIQQRAEVTMRTWSSPPLKLVEPELPLPKL
ncbi:hypothetical protein I8748_31115 [Nostoc sp. CENA67]|uniref:Uncharacterized protein n=1 Tax=Amazonocrinis nigriterrae CENA67 TaxID=2794033 RepID=A0A8J7HZY6_9NOST|nr:hypothetical protein [Amazonocrinis nigriterrae]MBH8566552.1 hypothetical protein [Amazonocrinis nigriterrae CENA67]